MDDERRIERAGEALVLHADRALYWPRRSTLVIADLHLGKGDHFRRAGIALPRGGTSHDLARLAALLRRTGAARLLVLGDFLHGAVADAPWRQRWRAWRAAHAALCIEVVPGNHDRALAPAAADLRVAVAAGALDQPPFCFVHRLEDADPGGHYVLAGHVHPVIRLPGLPRLPVFAFGRDHGLLPAFTAFAGGHPIAPARYPTILVCTPEGLHPLAEPSPPGAAEP